MLNKLMKYEFKATGRIYLPLFAALLIVSSVSRLLESLRSGAPHIIGVTAAAMLIVAACVITLILTIQRFHKNFMSSEGYLMFTLPVSTDRLIWSKLIVAAIWNIVCILAVCLSIAIMTMPGEDLVAMIQSFTKINIPTADYIFFMIELIAILLSLLLTSILSLYTCMALSLFANKHRVSIAFAIYVGMVIVMQTIAVIMACILANIDFSIGTGFANFIQTHPNGTVHAALLLVLLVISVVGAVFFLITRYMLKNKLNLQ